jgi:hypothetical protein
MRTKTLLLTAALGAAGVATSMAQGTTVFSVNAVGYVKVTVKPGFQLIANPLDAADNTIKALLANVPEGTTLYKFDASTGLFDIQNFFGVWVPNENTTLNPGEGAFILNPGTTDVTLTFVGEVKQGTLTQSVPAGFSIQASQVPQEGQLDTDLKYPAGDGDTVYKFDEATQLYEISNFFGDPATGVWVPSAPRLDVGESVFVNKLAAATWTRTFSVNNP